MSDTPAHVKCAPVALQQGDRFRVQSGPYRGHRVEVVAVREGRYGTYNVEARPLGNLEFSADYTEVFDVERLPIPKGKK